MATQSPFSILDRLAQSLGTEFKAPAWAIDEAQRRVVLLLNHILMQEPAAMERLLRYKGSVLRLQWRSFSIPFLVTPAGLLDVGADSATPDLRITVVDEAVGSIAQAALRGEKPAVRIDGDVQLAAEVNWLVENVRWDLEEDLSRILGDGPAHMLGQVGQRVVAALRSFIARPRRGPASSGGGEAA